MWVLEEEFYLPSPESPGREDDPAQVRPRDLAYTGTLPTRDLLFAPSPDTFSHSFHLHCPWSCPNVPGLAPLNYLALVTQSARHCANSCTSPSMEAIEQPYRWGALTAPLYLTRHREGK